MSLVIFGLGFGLGALNERTGLVNLREGQTYAEKGREKAHDGFRRGMRC